MSITIPILEEEYALLCAVCEQPRGAQEHPTVTSFAAFCLSAGVRTSVSANLFAHEKGFTTAADWLAKARKDMQ